MMCFAPNKSLPIVFGGCAANYLLQPFPIQCCQKNTSVIFAKTKAFFGEKNCLKTVLLINIDDDCS